MGQSTTASASTSTKLPTVGELQRQLSQRIQAFYKGQLEHQPGKVTCQLFDHSLAIVMEDAMTQPESLLKGNGYEDLASTVRSRLEQLVQPELKSLLEEVLQVDVKDLLSDATSETGRSGMIAILEATPNVRNPESIPQHKKSPSDSESK
jgi:uncharacterized protein YbcI